MFKKLILTMFLVTSSLSQARQIDRFFYTDEDQVIHEVKYENVDKLLRSIPAEKHDEVADKIVVRAVQMDDGEYALRAYVRGFGGGPIGASVGATLGGGVATVAFNGFYAAVTAGVSAVAGPIVGGTIGGTVRVYCMPAQLAATKVMALAGGIWLGAGTPF